MSLSFVSPGFAVLLAIVPFGAFLLSRLERRRSALLEEWIGSRRIALVTDTHASRRRAAALLSILAVSFMILALTRPVLGDDPRPQGKGLDVVVLLDVSRSMLAEDVAPSRLGRARLDIAALARRSIGDRFALVAFAGDARRLVPLTSDGETFARLVEEVDTYSVERGGTELSNALDVARASFGETGSRRRAILVVSDGGEASQAALAAAERCRDARLPIVALGSGTRAGARIPVVGAVAGTFVKDRDGREVVVGLDAGGLERLAQVSDGIYAASGDVAIARRHLETFAAAATSDGAIDGAPRGVERFQWPLILACLCFVARLLIDERRKA